MQRCRSSSFCNPVAAHCSCTDQHHHQYSAAARNTATFSLLFSSSPMPNHHSDYSFNYPATITSPSSSSSVDCTLSLSTPSSTNTTRHQRNSSSSSSPSCVSKLCSWNNIFQTNKQKNNSPSSAATRTTTGGGNTAGDSALTSRRCANCDTTSTPLWRNGPRGPKSLCNACGIRYKKEERRATSTTNGTGAMLDSQEQLTWTAQHAQSMSPSCTVTEFRFIEDDDGHSYMNTSTGGGAANIPFLPWRLNVPDRPSSLVHDYI